MFRNTIRESKFVSEDANELFKNKIEGDHINGDVTFLTAMRILLAPRMKDEDYAGMLYKVVNTDEREFKNIESIFSDSNAFDNQCYLRNITGFNVEEADKTYALLDKFEETYPQYTEDKSVEIFFQKMFKVRCFVDNKRHRSVVIVREPKRWEMHLLCIAISKFFPWFFEDNKITAEEKEFVSCFKEKTSDLFLEWVEKFAARYDFDKIRVSRLLKGFETRANKIALENEEDRLSNIRAEIKDRQRRIADLIKAMEQANITLLGLRAIIKAKGEKSEILDYFLSNKELKLIDVRNDDIEFVVETYLEYFNEDSAEDILDNEDSYFYEYSDEYSDDDVELLMRHVLIEKDVKLKFCAAYRFSTNSVDGISGYDFNSKNVGMEHMPNPHIQRYSCLGSYLDAISEYLTRGDYIGALAQACASCRSLNLGDSPVMKEFVRTLFKKSGNCNKKKCFEMPNGEVLAVDEAIEYLKKEATDGEIS